MNQLNLESNVILQDIQKILHFLNNFETFNHSYDSKKVSTSVDTITFRFKDKDLSQSKNVKRKKSIFSNIRDFISDGIEAIGLVNKKLKDSSLENAINNLNEFYDKKLEKSELIKKRLEGLGNSSSDKMMKELLSRRYEKAEKNSLINEMKKDNTIKKDLEYLDLFNEFQILKNDYNKKYFELQTILKTKIIPFFEKFVLYFNDSNLKKSTLDLVSSIENRLNNNEYVFENLSSNFEVYDSKLPQKKDLIELLRNIKNQIGFLKQDMQGNLSDVDVNFILNLNNLDDYFSEKKALLFKTLGLQYFDEFKLYEKVIKSKEGILVTLLLKIAKSDGIISVNESEYIYKQINLLNMDDEFKYIFNKKIINIEKDETFNIQNLCNNLLVFNDVNFKEFIKNLVEITKVDNKFYENQYKILSDIMKFINLSKADTKAFQIEILDKPNQECKKLYEKIYILMLEKEDIESKIEYYEYESFKNHGEIKFELLSLKKELSKECLNEYNNYLRFYNKYKNYTKKYDESLTNYKAYVDSHRLNLLIKIISNYKNDISFLEKDIEELKKNEFYKMSLNFTMLNHSFIHERETLNKELESLKKVKESNKIVVSKDNETEKLRNKLKNLEIKFQELIEQKTEYLNNMEEFNTQYNLHLGDLIKVILNLKKEILYKKTIKNQKLKEQYKSDKDIYNEIKQTIEELKNTIIELEKILENIASNNEENYDEIKNAYDEINEELQKLEEELLVQENELEETEEQIKENETFEEEYQEVKSTYEEFVNQYEHIKDTQKDIIKLSEEQQKELKLIFKKAAKLCHPDIVVDELKEKAHEIMQSLNDSYSKKDIEQVKKILISLENGTTFKTISCDIEDKELLKNKIKEFEQNISDLEEEILQIKLDETFITILELDNWDEYFEELKSELTKQKNSLEKEAMEVLEDENKNLSEEKEIIVEENKTKDELIESENSQYSKYIQSIENPNFEKIRRYCNNLLNDNKADTMQEYLANNGKMYKAIIYDALEQFISKFDGKNISLVDWGCGQGIASMIVLDYIKEKQLNIKVSNSILIDDIKALSRAMVHTDILSYSDDIKILAYDLNSDISDILKKLDNQTVLNLIVNDKIYEKIKNIDFENDFFLCLSNQSNVNIDKFYKKLTKTKDVQNVSIRDTKIGKFKKFERIFKVNK